MLIDNLLNLIDDMFLLCEFFGAFVLNFLELLQPITKVLDQIEFSTAHLLDLTLVHNPL